jgi:hypothetical protein
MGVDVDLVTPPSSEQSAIATAFAGLGVRQTRIAILEPNGAYQAVVKAFFAVNPNVSAFGLTDCAPPLGENSMSSISPADVGTFIETTGVKLDYVEGVNEPDNRGDATWPLDTRTCIAPFFGGVDGVPFLAPSLITELDGTDEMDLGTLVGQVSATNVHRYFNGYNPGTSGYGSTDTCGSYGGLAWSICWGKYSDPSVPVIVTETGWNSQTEVDELTQAKYVERLFFVNAEAGIAKTSLYTLLSYTGDSFGGDGLLRSDLSKKPAYTAVANITQLLADPGASYAPPPLPLLVTPAASTSGSGLRMMLLGKRDGSYQLALWQEVVSAIPGSYGSDSAPATVTATVGVGGLFTGTIDAWQNDGTVTATAAGTGVLFSVPVTDRLTILNLAPVN